MLLSFEIHIQTRSWYTHTSILVGSASLQKWQNSAFYDRAFKLGGDVLWTNINDLRYGAKKKFAMDPWKFTQYLQYTEIFVFTTSWTLSNIFIAYLLAIGGHWRLLIANIVQITSSYLLYLKTCGICITDVRTFSRGQKTIISVYCKYCANLHGSIASF